jgi:hypothetical protein
LRRSAYLAEENERVNSPASTDYQALQADFGRGRLDERALGELLSDSWATAYRAQARGKAELVEIDQGALTYLFDLAASRVVAVFGRASPTSVPRPASRMRGFPLPPSTGDELVRGHLVAHVLGGGTDINLVPQSAALNISGAWRRLERLAHAQPGAFLAVEVGYDDDSQTPSRFTYVVAAEGALTVEDFANV